MKSFVPEFIPRDKLRTWNVASVYNDIATIDGILIASYVQRCIVKNNPITFLKGEKTTRGGMNGHPSLYRLIDILVKAYVHGDKIGKVSNLLSEKKKTIKRLERKEIELKSRIEYLEKKANKSIVNIDMAQDQQDIPLILSENSIVKRAVSKPLRLVGVYFLVKDSKVIYVGQSVSLIGRLSHHSLNKDFDSWCYIECLKEKLDLIESFYIHILQPPLNGTLRNGEKTAPISYEEVFNILNLSLIQA